MTPEVPWDLIGGGLVVVGSVLLTLATLSLCRIPDFAGRLHALTIADNLGLGALVLGLCLLSRDLAEILLLGLIWLVVLFAGTSAARLLLRVEPKGGDDGR